MISIDIDGPPVARAYRVASGTRLLGFSFASGAKYARTWPRETEDDEKI
jgi:hypothetical protein